MIRFCPRRVSLSLSLKDELLFESMDDLTHYVLDRWRRLSAYLDAADPIRPEEIVISDPVNFHLIGLRNTRQVLVLRTVNTVYKKPLCIGYCGE